MLKCTVAVLAVVLAGTAAAGWRDLRVEGTGEAAFEQSLAEFKDKLSRARQQVFAAALRDIWDEGRNAAAAEQRQYTTADYHRQLDGLSYDEVVTLTDPTGKTAKDRYHDASLSGRYRPAVAPPTPNWPSRPMHGWGSTGDRLARSD